MPKPLQHPHRSRSPRTHTFHTIYDGNGKRVKKVTNAETTVFVYDGMGKIVAEYSTATPPSNPTVNYTATDQLGSPRVLTNAIGEVVSRRDFLPFGEELFADSSNRTTSRKYATTDQDAVRQRFTGYPKDAETSLDFAEARMYENRYGRFTAVDPLLASGKSGNPQTFNRYVYVLNRPLLFTDPTGLQVANWSQRVYANATNTEFSTTRGNGFTPYNGSEIVFVGNGNYWWRVWSNGWQRLGKFEGERQDLNPVVEVQAETELIEASETTPIQNLTPGQGIEFIPGNNLTENDRSIIADEASDMLSMPGCRDSFVSGGLRNPMNQKFFVGSVNQLDNGSSAASLGLTDYGLTTSRQAFNNASSSLNETVASNNLQWLGEGNARTIDDNPRMFVAPANFFGQRSYSPFAWSSRTNTIHARQHGAGAPNEQSGSGLRCYDLLTSGRFRG